MIIPGKTKRVTLAVVAERAGVSTATVSLILSGREEWLKQFNPNTVEKVRAAAKRLGYRANLFAAGLPTQASHFFALVVHDIDSKTSTVWHHWAFEGALMAGVIQTATDNQLYPILATANPDMTEEALRPVEHIIEGGVFGTIIRTPNTLLEKFLRSRMKRGHRFVIVFPQRLANWASNAIDVNNVAIGETVAKLLAARGRKRCVFVRYKVLRDSHTLRAEGFIRVARERGIDVKTVQLPMEVDEYSARDFLAKHFKRLKADGLFAVDSVSSVGALLGGVALGWKPAEDFDLVGCDCSLWQSSPLPMITAVDVSWKEAGALAMKQLRDMQQADQSRFDNILMMPRIVRAGTCPVPAGFDVSGKQRPKVTDAATETGGISIS